MWCQLIQDRCFCRPQIFMQGVDAFTTLTCQNRNYCWVNVKDVYNLQEDSACVTFHTGRRFSVKYRVIHLLKHRRSSLQLFWQLASNSTTLQTSKLTACLINYCVHLKAPRTRSADRGVVVVVFSPLFLSCHFPPEADGVLLCWGRPSKQPDSGPSVLDFELVSF